MQRGQRLGQAADPGYPHRDARGAQLGQIGEPALLLIGQDQIGDIVTIAATSGLFVLADTRRPKTRRMGARVRHAGQQRGCAGRHRLGQRGHQRHHAADHRRPPHWQGEIIGNRPPGDRAAAFYRARFHGAHTVTAPGGQRRRGGGRAGGQTGG